MEYVTRNINIRKGQDQALIALAAKLQAKRGKTVSISEVMREVIDHGIAHAYALLTTEPDNGHTS